MTGIELMLIRMIALPLLGRWAKYLKGKAAASTNPTDDKLAGALEVVIEAAKEVAK